MALVSVAPNKVIKLQIKNSSGSGTVNFDNNKFIVYEI
jgi:hypothetical protein